MSKDVLSVFDIGRMGIMYGLSINTQHKIIKYGFANEKEDVKDLLFVICRDSFENHKEASNQEFDWIKNFKPKNGEKYRSLAFKIYRDKLGTMEYLYDIYENVSSVDEFILKVSVPATYPMILMK